MCMTKSELESKVQEIRKYKAMIEEASNIEKEKHSELPVFPKELVYAYCDFYNYTLKDYNDMLEFDPESVSEHIRRFEQTVIKTDENIEKD